MSSVPRTILDTDVSGDDTAPCRARALLAGFRCGLSDAQRTDARLAVNELVTRACDGGYGPIKLHLETYAEGLRASVRRKGNDFDLKANEGLGLAVLQATTDAWGPVTGRAGVWFEVGTD
jgi:hypothetical protein